MIVALLFSYPDCCKNSVLIFRLTYASSIVLHVLLKHSVTCTAADETIQTASNVDMLVHTCTESVLTP